MSPADARSAIEERDAIGEETKRGAFVRRISSGELGSLRVIIVLVVIWAIFQIANDRFLTSVNLENLMLQINALGRKLTYFLGQSRRQKGQCNP